MFILNQMSNGLYFIMNKRQSGHEIDVYEFFQDRGLETPFQTENLFIFKFEKFIFFS